MVFHLKVSADKEDLEIAGFEKSVTVAANGEELRPLVLVVPSREYHGSFDFTVDVHSDRGSVDFTRELTFLGPDTAPSGKDHGDSDD